MAVESIGRLIKTIERLSDLPRAVAIEAAGPLTAELRKQFDSGTDPYGRPWAPLRPTTLAKGRHEPPLTDTGRLRDGSRAAVAPGGRAGLRLMVGAKYGYFHQVGFRVGRTTVPPRRILPQFGLPRAWSLILRQAARTAAKRAGR